MVRVFVLFVLSCLALAAHAGCPGEASPKTDHRPVRTDLELAREATPGLAPRLVLHRKSPAGVERLVADAVARPGDLIQVSYIAAGHARGVIVSMDGGGRVTLHHPTEADFAPTLRPRGENALPYSFELDEAPGYERFFFVVGDNEGPSPRQIVAAAERLASHDEDARTAPLPLSPRWRQTSITLRKP